MAKTATKKAAKSTKGKKGAKKSTKSKSTDVKKEEPVVEKKVVVEEVNDKKALTPGVESAKSSKVVPDMKLDDNITLQMETLSTTIQSLITQLKSAQSELTSLKKNYAKELKSKNKLLAKKKNTNRLPSGFAKPCKISKEMAKFLSLDENELIARNQVTKLINQYIIDNDLRNEKDKRQIQPNKQLTKLLNLSGDEQLSYFNLQKYMKHHFIKEQTA